MKEYIKNTFLYILIFSFAISLFDGISLPISFLYTILTLILLSISILLAQPILKFLTISVNFLTFLLMSSILSSTMLYLLNTFMVGFEINQSTFQGIDLDFVTINGFEMNTLFTIISLGFFASLISSIFYGLEKK